MIFTTEDKAGFIHRGGGGVGGCAFAEGIGTTPWGNKCQGAGRASMAQVRLE